MSFPIQNVPSESPEIVALREAIVESISPDGVAAAAYFLLNARRNGADAVAMREVEWLGNMLRDILGADYGDHCEEIGL